MKKTIEENTLLPIRRSFATLKICAEKPEGVSFSELKNRLSPIVPCVLSRLLKVLLAEKAIKKNENGLYTCGSLLHDIGVSLKPSIDISKAIENQVKALASSSGISASFFELKNSGLFLFAKSEVPDGFHYIDLNCQMGNIPNHTFSQIAIVFGGNNAIKMLSVRKSELKNKILLKRFCEISNGKMAFLDLNGNRIFRIGAPVYENRQFRGVAGVSTYIEIKDKNKLINICSLVKHTATKIGELYESNHGNV